ncbi:MAG TPA: glycosyltransferase family 39 protein, partial [Burkholderiaceae bacterium]|nr:glycosyltransferase family 39 protein [Burkholderiaceae bacterium]
PLFYWFGAALIRLLGAIVAPDEVARLTSLLAMAVAAAAVWYGTYLLGRRPEAQPQQFAFGGHPAPKDYGRVLADSGLLLAIATLGLLVRAHESSAEIGQFAATCVVLFGLIRALDRPVRGALFFGLASAALVLTRNFAALLMPAVSMVALLLLSPSARAVAKRFVPIAVMTTVLPLAAWWFAMSKVPGGEQFRSTWLSQTSWNTWIAQPSVWLYYLRNLPWFVWPAWPLAALAAWTWRRQWRSPHIAVAIAGALGAVSLFAFGQPPGDTAMLMIVPPILMLCAFGLPALSRSVANLIDWFALLAFSLFALGVWFCWFAITFGLPPRVAANFARIAPGYEGTFSVVGFGIALAVTLAWAMIVRWRVATRPAVLWRSALLPSSGLVLVWTVLIALTLPYVDYLKTYRYVSAEVAKRVPPGACVYAEPFGLPQRASFAYFNGLRFGDASCRYLLRHRGSTETLPDIDTQRWRLIWEGRRAADRRERIELYRR